MSPSLNNVAHRHHLTPCLHLRFRVSLYRSLVVSGVASEKILVMP